ncbi:WYL domain-containing protein [Nocardioides sp.]|uniref:WYL domain-containing protein n=1 Tax=Nocardioides sp. TaxID=35761 RepID=UPI0035195292
MARLARLLRLLHDRGRSGVSATDLIRVAGYGGAAESGPDQLSADLRNLRRSGWQIDNVAPPGADARYRLVSVDNRLRVTLTDRQRAALQRALILVERDDLAARLGVAPASLPPGIGVDVLPHRASDALSRCHQAVRAASRIRFVYKGTPRVVHPGSVRFQNYQWYLSGLEEGGEQVKHFIVADMHDVALDEPGTARRVPGVGRIPLHPLRWEIDPPTTVTLTTTPEHVEDVVRWLMAPAGADDIVEVDGVVRMRYVITHLAAFRARLHILGPRVRLEGDGEGERLVREQLIADLRTMVGL